MSAVVRPFATVVSGVPRSGTSLVLRMLVAGGIPALSDGVRVPDADNPEGYRELEAVRRLPATGPWLARAEGRALKVIHRLLPRLPLAVGAPAWRVVCVRRRLPDVVRSQQAMLARRGGAPPEGLPVERLEAIFAAELAEALRWVREEAGLPLHVVDYEALCADPAAAAADLDRFLGGGLDRAAMAAAVDPARGRSPAPDRYTPRTMPTVALGNVRLSVEHRMPGPAGGPTLRVCRAEDGRELLRFDCFAEGAHWHLDPAGRDEITALPPGLDALEWTLAELRRDLPGYLARAGLPEARWPEQAAGAALARVESALRHPPLELDALDEAVLRQRSGEKWRSYPDDVLPLWVADMDFPVAEPIRRRLQHMLDVGDLGYPLHPRPTRLPALFAERAMRRFGWEVDPRRVELITDVVQGLFVALQVFSAPGDGVVVQTPIYPPFLGAVREMGRTLLESPLRAGAGGYAVDLADLRRHAEAGARMLLLCSPHNPTGRVLRREELEGIAEIVLGHDLVVVSDEIHADLVFPGTRHLPFAALSPEVAARTLTLTSASKPFNIAGLRCAVAVFGSPELKRRFLGCPRHLRGGLAARRPLAGRGAGLSGGEPGFRRRLRGARAAGRGPPPAGGHLPGLARLPGAGARSFALRVLPARGAGGAVRRSRIRSAGPGLRARQLRHVARDPDPGPGAPGRGREPQAGVGPPAVGSPPAASRRRRA